MRYIALCFFLSLSMSPAAHAQGPFSTGAMLDNALYQTVPKTPPLARGGYGSLPPAVSLKRFAPTPGNQGRQGSCVGWATAYAARTLAEAHRLGVENRSQINRSVFSPAFIYNQIKVGSCGDGSLPSKALDLMSSVGVLPLADFPYTDQSCSATPQARQTSMASQYRIKGYQRLFNADSTAKHIAVRRALANGHPVVIGMMVSEAFMRSSGHYKPGSSDVSLLERGQLGGHAMAVIGYDDTKYGGAFELINSWGQDWGNDGFMWVTYGDFNTFVQQGYEMIPPDPPKPPAVVDMGGKVGFIHISGKPMSGRALSDGNGYRLAESYPSGTRFRVEISADDGGFVYALGGDLSGRFVELFPRRSTVSPHIDGGGAMLMPGPSEDFFTRMNDDTGTDFYVVLFSREALPIAEIVADVNKASGDVHAKLARALGNRMVDPDQVKAVGNGIAFEAASDGRMVVPVVVAIDHVAPSGNDRDRTAPKLVVSEPAGDELEQIVDPNAIRRVATPVFRLRGIAQDENLIQRVNISGAATSKFSSRGPFEAEIELPQDGKPHPVTIVAVDADGNSSESTIQIQVAP